MAINYPADHPDLWRDLGARDLKREVFALPTDTLYGLSCAISNENGKARIRAMKNRPESKFIVLIPDMSYLDTYFELSSEKRKLLEQYWPGPISFVLNDKAGGSTAARLPDNAFLQRFVELAGEPIVSTSCNLHGKPSLTEPKAILEQFGDDLDFIISKEADGQPLASTVVDLRSKTPEIIRQGAVTFAFSPS